ncbi:MAG: hypothetical protein RI900_188 [Actinomycetota bacterium]
MLRTLRPLAVAVLVLFTACSGENKGTTTSAATSAPTSTAVAPTIETATVQPHANNVLLATLSASTDAPARLSVSLVDGDRSRDLVTTETVGTEHTVPIRGLHADRTQTIRITPISPDGSLVGAATDVEITTKPLPFTLPELTAAVSKPDLMAPGYTLFDPVQTTDMAFNNEGRAEQPAGLLVAVDEQGEVVWYLTHPRPIADARILPDGTLMYESLDTEVVFADLDGNIRSRLTSRLYDGTVGNDVPTVKVDTDALHHEADVLPNGNLISLSATVHTVEVPEPLCGEAAADFTGTYSFISDLVVEVDIETGEVVSQYDLWELLDPMADPERRDICGTAMQGNAVFPVKVYADSPGRIIDWTHANAVILDEDRNVLMVSVRHMNQVIGIRYADDADGPAGELLWELGEDGTVPYDGDAFSHQHAVELQPDGSIQLYDNRNEMPEPQQSRAVRIALEGDGSTPTGARQVWQYLSTLNGQPAYSFAVGDADTQPNGNVLITNGFYSLGSGGLNSQIVEVVPEGDNGGTVAFELQVGGPGGWFVYRAERIPSLYPTAV